MIKTAEAGSLSLLGHTGNGQATARSVRRTVRVTDQVAAWCRRGLLQAGGRDGKIRADLYEGGGGVLGLGDGGQVEIGNGAGLEDETVG